MCRARCGCLCRSVRVRSKMGGACAGKPGVVAYTSRGEASETAGQSGRSESKPRCSRDDPRTEADREHRFDEFLDFAFIFNDTTTFPVRHTYVYLYEVSRWIVTLPLCVQPDSSMCGV